MSSLVQWLLVLWKLLLRNHGHRNESLWSLHQHILVILWLNDLWLLELLWHTLVKWMLLRNLHLRCLMLLFYRRCLQRIRQYLIGFQVGIRLVPTLNLIILIIRTNSQLLFWVILELLWGDLLMIWWVVLIGHRCVHRTKRRQHPRTWMVKVWRIDIWMRKVTGYDVASTLWILQVLLLRMLLDHRLAPAISFLLGSLLVRIKSRITFVVAHIILLIW